MKGNPTWDAKWNKCAKNARTKRRARHNDPTLTCVHRFHKDLGGTKFNPKGPWKDAIKRQFKLAEFTLEMAEQFDEICDEADAVKAEGLKIRSGSHEVSCIKPTHIITLCWHQMSSKELACKLQTAMNMEAL